MKGGETMALITMTKEEFDKAIEAQTAVSMALRYLDECRDTDELPDADWLRFLLNGCSLEPWQIKILWEEDSPEEPRTHKKGHRVREHLMPEEEFDPEQI